jgi:hypothetical protein
MNKQPSLDVRSEEKPYISSVAIVPSGFMRLKLHVRIKHHPKQH